MQSNGENNFAPELVELHRQRVIRAKLAEIVGLLEAGAAGGEIGPDRADQNIATIWPVTAG